MRDDVEFYDMTPSGAVKIRMMKISDIQKCPKFIFLPTHYRADNSCRCDETECEMNGCNEPKYNEEIYCQRHCDGY